MADGVVFSSTGQSPPANTGIWTDELTVGGSTVHAQIVKLANPTLDSTVMLGMTSGGLNVAVVNTALAVTLSTASKIQTEETANLSTGSIIRVDSIASFPANSSNVAISGNSTAIISTASKIIAESTGVFHVDDNGGSLTIDGNSTAIISTASKIVAELSTTGMGGSTSTPVFVTLNPYSTVTSTFYNGTLTSTSPATAFSSAASTRFIITAIDLVNSSGTATEFSLYDGGTGGTLLYRQWCASAGGGISRIFPTPRITGVGSSVVIQINPAGNVYVSMDVLRAS